MIRLHLRDRRKVKDHYTPFNTVQINDEKLDDFLKCLERHSERVTVEVLADEYFVFITSKRMEDIQDALMEYSHSNVRNSRTDYATMFTIVLGLALFAAAALKLIWSFL